MTVEACVPLNVPILLPVGVCVGLGLDARMASHGT